MKNRIRETLKLRNMRPEELARAIGKGRSTIYNYEAARTEPKLSLILKMAGLLNVSVGYLMGFDESGKGDQHEQN